MLSPLISDIGNLWFPPHPHPDQSQKMFSTFIYLFKYPVSGFIGFSVLSSCFSSDSDALEENVYCAVAGQCVLSMSIMSSWFIGLFKPSIPLIFLPACSVCH